MVIRKKFFKPLVILFFCFCLLVNFSLGQIVISGTVYDSTTLYSVKEVLVKSTGGAKAFTDSAGIYHINVSEKDSIYFFYADKYTAKFPVTSISNYTHFDISLRVRLHEKYKPLKEVIVYSKSFRQDSMENRIEYDKAFEFTKPQLSSDINELISIFQFKRNKQKLHFQKRLIEQEQDRYIDYKFNTKLIKRITGLQGADLEKYKFQYRPSYQFLSVASEVDFYEYILSTAARYKKDNLLN